MQQATKKQLEMFVPPALNFAPKLLVAWQPWWPTFLTNLADTLLRRKPPPEVFSSRPAEFWPDVFVHRPLPWNNFGQSAGLHAGLVLLIVATGHLWFTRSPTLRDPYTHTSITYYDVADLLPPVISAGPKAQSKQPQKGEPALAKQEIISVPNRPDNSTQTIVNPPHPDITRQEAALPNLMVWTPVPQAPPIAALARSQITLPTLPVNVVAPAPDTNPLRQSKLKVDAAKVAEPAPELDQLQTRKNDLVLAQAKADPAAPAPKLDLPLQRVALPQQGADAVPPPPSLQNTPSSRQAAGQLMALNVRPTAPSGEIKVPDGSRSGIFAATPTGHAGAAGTPDIPAAKVDGDARASSADGTKSKTGAGSGAGVPAPGITITGGTASPIAGAVVAKSAPAAPTSFPSGPRMEANAAPPSFADLGRKPVPTTTTSTERKIEDKVFAGRKSYSMQLNMANLTSAGGSWIIHFAELKESSDKSDLATPTVMSKVDPAYPPDLIKDQVEGVVTLYAVIHADGTVGEVRLLQGIHERLDENAQKALLRWHFHPATKNGVPVDLEAVVQVPFKIRHMISGY